MATPNFNWTEVSASQNQKEVTINDVFNKIEDALSETSGLSITSSNAYAVSNAELREAFFLNCTDGGVTNNFTVTVPAIERGLFAVINNTSFVATVEISGQSEPSPTIEAGEMKFLSSGGSNVRESTAGVSAFLSLTDTPSSFAGQGGRTVIVNDGETALEFGTASAGAAGAVAVHPEHKGAQLKLSSDLAVADDALVHVPWGAAEYDTSFEPDTGAAQRFWLGPDQTFVDGNVTVGTDQINIASHGFATGEGPLELSNSGGSLPTGLATSTEYWVIAVDANNIQFATSRANALAGTPVDITAAAGGGTHTLETATRLVVPNGVTKVRLVAQASWEDIGTNSGARFINIDKNGASFQGGGAVEHNAAEGAETDEKTRQVVSSGVVEVVEGDYFEMQVRHRQGVSLNLTQANSTNFFIEVVETTKSTQLPTAFISVQPAHKGALVTKTGTQSTNAGSDTKVVFTAADYDTLFQPDDTGGSQRFWLGADQTFTTVDTGDNHADVTGHGFETGEGPFQLTTSGTLPTGLAASTNYWAINASADELRFATSRANALAGTAVNITGAGTGTHTIETADYLVVPADITKVRLHGGANLQNLATAPDFNIFFEKNDAAFAGASAIDTLDSGGTDFAAIASPTVAVSEGDRFSLVVLTSAAETIADNANQNFFAIEVVETSKSQTFPGVTVERPWIGARIEKTSDQSITTGTNTVVTWQQTGVDTGYRGTSFADLANDRFTIPAGVTKIRLTTNLRFQGFSGEYDQAVRFRKNGSNAFDGVGFQHFRAPTATNTAATHISTAVLDVVAGDDFDVQVFQNSGGGLNVQADSQNNTWFEIEVVETEEAAQPPLDLSFFVGGTPGAGVKVGKHTATRRFTLNDDLSGSQAHADTAATASSVFDVQRNGVSIGSITFAAAATTATFSTTGSSEEVFAIGDRLTVVAPNPADATLADVAITLFGYRS